MEDLWSIVEFEDGMEMIPTSWIIEDKSAARWPNFTSHLKFMKAVKNRILYENEWSLYKIKKILGTSKNDDLEVIKKSRKERAKKTISSSEDNDSDEENIQLSHYPKVPQTKNNTFYTKSKKCDDKSKKQFIKETVNTCKEQELKSKDTNVCEIQSKNDSDFVS
ncbi:hypothetical protein RF55_18401, partial [Lasius niger]